MGVLDGNGSGVLGAGVAVGGVWTQPARRIMMIIDKVNIRFLIVSPKSNLCF
jgi:hypothetical protein